MPSLSKTEVPIAIGLPGFVEEVETHEVIVNHRVIGGKKSRASKPSRKSKTPTPNPKPPTPLPGPRKTPESERSTSQIAATKYVEPDRLNTNWNSEAPSRSDLHLRLEEIDHCSSSSDSALEQHEWDIDESESSSGKSIFVDDSTIACSISLPTLSAIPEDSTSHSDIKPTSLRSRVAKRFNKFMKTTFGSCVGIMKVDPVEDMTFSVQTRSSQAVTVEGYWYNKVERWLKMGGPSPPQAVWQIQPSFCGLSDDLSYRDLSIYSNDAGESLDSTEDLPKEKTRFKRFRTRVRRFFGRKGKT